MPTSPVTVSGSALPEHFSRRNLALHAFHWDLAALPRVVRCRSSQKDAWTRLSPADLDRIDTRLHALLLTLADMQVSVHVLGGIVRETLDFWDGARRIFTTATGTFVAIDDILGFRLSQSGDISLEGIVATLAPVSGLEQTWLVTSNGVRTVPVTRAWLDQHFPCGYEQLLAGTALHLADHDLVPLVCNAAAVQTQTLPDVEDLASAPEGFKTRPSPT